MDSGFAQFLLRAKCSVQLYINKNKFRFSIVCIIRVAIYVLGKPDTQYLPQFTLLPHLSFPVRCSAHGQTWCKYVAWRILCNSTLLLHWCGCSEFNIRVCASSAFCSFYSWKSQHHSQKCSWKLFTPTCDSIFRMPHTLCLSGDWNVLPYPLYGKFLSPRIIFWHPSLYTVLTTSYACIPVFHLNTTPSSCLLSCFWPYLVYTPQMPISGALSLNLSYTCHTRVLHPYNMVGISTPHSYLLPSHSIPLFITSFTAFFFSFITNKLCLSQEVVAWDYEIFFKVQYYPWENYSIQNGNFQLQLPPVGHRDFCGMLQAYSQWNELKCVSFAFTDLCSYLTT